LVRGTDRSHDPQQAGFLPREAVLRACPNTEAITEKPREVKKFRLAHEPASQGLHVLDDIGAMLPDLAEALGVNLVGGIARWPTAPRTSASRCCSGDHPGVQMISRPSCHDLLRRYAGKSSNRAVGGALLSVLSPSMISSRLIVYTPAVLVGITHAVVYSASLDFFCLTLSSRPPSSTLTYSIPCEIS